MHNKNYEVSSSSSSGIGFFGLLTILFIALKLTGQVNWSWIWVLSPIWIGFLVSLATIVLIFLFALWTNRREWKK
jgi:hypothetical protein